MKPFRLIRRIRPISTLRDFLRSEAASGVILIGVAAAAIGIANSPLSSAYFDFLHAKIGPLPVLEWINDGLMTLFFLLLGLEIKREVIEGRLATWSRVLLPAIAAVGGIAVPAAIYFAVQQNDPETLRGWAVPAATDIAFALGVIVLLGDRVPVSLRLFLSALAIIDDIGAVAIIAVFYTWNLDTLALAGAAVATATLFAFNYFRLTRISFYLVAGGVLWYCMLNAGVHATIAGIIIAFAVPLKPKSAMGADRASPLIVLEHELQPWISYLVVPLFGFANAGVLLTGLQATDIGSSVPLGVALGLFFGKQIGVFGTAWLAIKLKIASLPPHATWRQLYGTAVLCGIGFTMSLFIALLAFNDPAQQYLAKIGVLAGSFASAIAGYLILRFAKPRERPLPPVS
jgi:NhaA family Na+:H+ antiporter